MDTTAQGCTGKKAYPSHSVARRAAQHVNRNHDDGHVAPYHCKACKRWHVGNSTPKPKRRETAPDMET